MASSGYYYSPYYQPAPYYSYSQQRARGAAGGGLPSVQAFLLAVTASVLAVTTLYAWCESAVGSLLDLLRRLLILAPLLLILTAQLWVASGGERRVGAGGGLLRLVAELVEGDQSGQYYGYGHHRAGGGSSSPWGVALALVLVLLLVSYRSSFQERWFSPLLGR